MALDEKERVLRELADALDSIDAQAVGRLEDLVIAASQVFCYGLGRSGLCCRGFAMRLMHLGLQCSIVGDLLAHPIHSGDLLIITSASGAGETLEILAKKGKELGAKIALITSGGHAALSALADIIICIDAPTKSDCGNQRVSIMPMGSLFEEAAFLLFDLVIVDLMNRMNIGNEDMVCRHANLE